MSIEYTCDRLTPDLRRRLIKDLHIQKKTPQNRRAVFHTPPTIVVAYALMEKNTLALPYAYARQTLDLVPRPRSSYAPFTCPFEGMLRDPQKEVVREALEHLNTRGSTLLAPHVGFGKSILAIDLMCRIRLRPIIIVHRLVLVDQWVSAVERHCPGVVICTSGTVKEEDLTECTVLIVSVMSVQKLSEAVRSRIGCVIVDECHLISTKHFSSCLQYLFPRYVFGLSATPYRDDGLDTILDVYFGTRRIVRELHTPHQVYVISTHIAPPETMTARGTVDWNAVLTWQSTHAHRNDMICHIVHALSSRCVLVLCKRREHVKVLSEMMRARGEHVTTLAGTEKTFDREARILVGTTSKIGTGFSHDKLDMLVLATDVQSYSIQVIGRVMRRPDVRPLIVDIVDRHPLLKRHFATRRKVYKDIGGDIMDTFHEDYPSVPRV
jgi:superfamily II DNA or RNA helicase